MRMTSEQMKRNQRTSLLIWLSLVLVIIATIFAFSSQTGAQSDAVSKGLVVGIIRLLRGNASAATVLRYNGIIRKVAHFGMFALLGIALAGAFRHQNRLPKLLTAIVVAIVFAALDEIHQVFVDGRGAELRDVLIDSAGAVAGALLLTRTVRLIQKRNKRKEEENARSNSND